jgi:hypothetical protein
MDPVRRASMRRYIEAAERPEIALQRLGAGRGTREDVETLQALHPRQYQRYIAAVGDRLGKVKTLPSITQRQRIAFATGMPMAREQRPESVAFLQGLATPQPEVEDAAQQQAMPKRSSRSPDRHYASRTDDILSAGADDRD